MEWLWQLLGSQAGGTIVNTLLSLFQQETNELTREQQEGLVGQALGVAGLGDVSGIEAAESPMDISRLEPMAQALSDMLSTKSRSGMREGVRGLYEVAGPGSEVSEALRYLPDRFGRANQGILDQFGEQAGDITGQFQEGAGGLLDQFGTGASDIGRGHAGRLTGAMGMLEGRGKQAEEDISTRFRESLAGEKQALRARGFGGTLAANIAQGSAREESAEQRRLQEQLRGERLGLYTGLTGEGLAARERLLGAGTTLGQGLLGAGTGLQSGFAGQQLQAGQAGQQFLGGLNLSALGQQGQLGQFLQNALMQNRQQNLSNQFQFGQYPIGVGQQVAGTALSALGPIDIRTPEQLQLQQVLPYGG